MSQRLAINRSARPIKRDFYQDIRVRVGGWRFNGQALEVSRESILRIQAGSLVSFELLEGPQIVNVFFWNTDDPDERYWAEQTMLLEGSYLQRYTRLWGTMARFRPLATVIEDTVVTLRRPGQPQAFHHFAHGGSGTPADWSMRGGRTGVMSTWELLVSAMDSAGVEPDFLTENASLFQKTAIDPIAQVISILPSDALAGDRVVWFAEIDLTLAIALSPYQGGGVPVSKLDGSTRRVGVRVEPNVAEPLGWPYPGIRYPDLSLYADETGRRDRTIRPTPGIEYGQ